MAIPRLYGLAASRALRSIWAMEETGIDYEHIPTHYFGDSKQPDYLAVNPNGRIPALVDGDLVLCESMAINLYVTKRYAPHLYPNSPADEAKTWQWSVWAISEIEPLQMRIVVQKLFTAEDKRNPAVIEEASAALARPLEVLEAQLATDPYLLGATFTVADLNLAGVMQLLRAIQFTLDPYPAVTRWLDQCYARPAFAAAQARD